MAINDLYFVDFPETIIIA